MARNRPVTSSRSVDAPTINARKVRAEPSRGRGAGAAGVAPAAQPRGNETARYTLGVESDCIVVRHTGQLTLREIEASRQAVAELATEMRLARILLDLSGATSGLAPVEIFELCASQSFVLPQNATVAVVYRPGQFPAEDARFAETVSLNRGATLQVFVDFEAARRWLGAETAGATR
jgi:hypothetical protein